MQKLLPLAKKSAKEVFLQLRENWPYFCDELKKEIEVTKLFFNHIILNNDKKREIRDLIERILIIPFIEKILTKWKITEKRKGKWVEYFKLSINNWDDVFSIIILKKSNKFTLLSCFIDFKQKK